MECGRGLGMQHYMPKWKGQMTMENLECKIVYHPMAYEDDFEFFK